MDIKILIAAHKPYWMPSDPVYVPLQVGAAGKQDLGYVRDDTGDNISSKNPNFCELTGLYWAWKNLKADYIGLVHYRRYFTRKEVHNIDGKRDQILTGSDWERLLSRYTVVVADKRKYYIESNLSHYNHAHHPEGMIIAREILAEQDPDYLPAFDKVMNRTWAHMFNMFVMRRDLFDAYMEWVFGVLFELEKRVDITGWDVYESRIYGFVSELLLDVWLEKNGMAYHEQNVSFMEKQNWVKKGGAFLKRKVFGR
ncbi:MAG: Capsular biosynthesis protein [Succiniclasticum sp.]